MDGPDGYPSAERLVKVGKGTFSRSRVFEHLDLADAAVDAWHERERASGRATRRRRKRRGVVPVREEGQSLGDNDAIAANVKLDAQLAHAVKVAKDASRRADRLASENKELGRKLARLGKGIHDEVWPERTLETATFPGDPLDKGEDADLDHQRELSANDDDR